MVSLTGGTIFLMWLGEQITQRGVGNGISLIIFSGIVARLPSAFATTLELGRTGALELWVIFLLAVVVIAVIGFIVFFERAQRRIIVQYPKRQVGNKMFGGEASHLPLKLNSSGVIPPIFASSLLLLPVSIAGFGAGANSRWAQFFSLYLGHGKPLYLLLYVALIVFFAFFYTAVVFNPVDTADNLKKYGGFIPGIRPGKKYGRLSGLRVDAAHRRRLGLSRHRLRAAGGAAFLAGPAVLFRRHQLADRRFGDHGHGGPDPFPPAGAPV